MTRQGHGDELLMLPKRQRNNPAYQLRVEGYRWNVSQIAKALNFDRATVARRLRAAVLAPDGRVHGTPVYELSRAMPAMFGCPPKNPKR